MGGRGGAGLCGGGERGGGKGKERRGEVGKERRGGGKGASVSSMFDNQCSIFRLHSRTIGARVRRQVVPSARFVAPKV